MLRRCPLPRPEEFAAMKGGHLAGMKGGHLAGEDGQDTITVAAGQAAWTLRPSPREVAVEDGPADNPRVVIEGAPDPVLRWLWGEPAMTRSSSPATRLGRLPAANVQVS
jgi:hypothetical protein